MSEKKLELVFLCDRSGSMGGLESDTIGGYNAMLQKQKAQPGCVRVTTVLFDDQYELLHDRLEIQAVAPITEREYYVRGCTALLDAMGKTIRKIAAVQQSVAPEYRADQVLFVIITDGMENASREYRLDQVRAMVEREKAEHGWEFLFLGANIDAIQTAQHFGIGADRAVDYHADSIGTQLNYEAVSQTITHLRKGTPLDEHWKDAIEADYRSRKPRRDR